MEANNSNIQILSESALFHVSGGAEFETAWGVMIGFAFMAGALASGGMLAGSFLIGAILIAAY